MKKIIEPLIKDKATLYLVITSILILIVTLIISVFFYFRLPPYIPIFNQLPWGDERLTPTIGIFIPVAVLTFVLMFNIFFSTFLYKKNNPLLGRIISSISLLISIMNFIFIVHTILLII